MYQNTVKSFVCVLVRESSLGTVSGDMGIVSRSELYGDRTREGTGMGTEKWKIHGI